MAGPIAFRHGLKDQRWPTVDLNTADGAGAPIRASCSCPLNFTLSSPKAVSIIYCSSRVSVLRKHRETAR